MTQHSALPSPALLQRHLHGVRYPATKAQLLAHARGECARIIGTLALLPEEQYSRPTDVSKAFGELAQEILKGASYPASRDDLVAYARDQDAFGEIARETLRGADYPASRDDLVQYAREQDADTVVIAALLEIPDEEYGNPDAVVVELVAV